jgi:alanine-glyoxylate transaminase / serine-glyoxylate transaminase / serine-pyruvate transaminase
MRRAYFEFSDHMKANASGYFPYTPALPMLHGLRESLAMLEEEGLENVFATAVRAWGLKLCARDPKWHSNTVSAIMVPHGFNGAEVIDRAYRRYNFALGARLSQMAGKLFRIGHLGDLNELMLLGAISGAEMAMNDIGIEVELGSGVAAAQARFRGAQMREQKRIAAE